MQTKRKLGWDEDAVKNKAYKKYHTDTLTHTSVILQPLQRSPRTYEINCTHTGSLSEKLRYRYSFIFYGAL